MEDNTGVGVDWRSDCTICHRTGEMVVWDAMSSVASEVITSSGFSAAVPGCLLLEACLSQCGLSLQYYCHVCMCSFFLK